jgi:hypothetical protein
VADQRRRPSAAALGAALRGAASVDRVERELLSAIAMWLIGEATISDIAVEFSHEGRSTQITIRDDVARGRSAERRTAIVEGMVRQLLQLRESGRSAMGSGARQTMIARASPTLAELETARESELERLMYDASRRHGVSIHEVHEAVQQLQRHSMHSFAGAAQLVHDHGIRALDAFGVARPAPPVELTPAAQRALNAERERLRPAPRTAPIADGGLAALCECGQRRDTHAGALHAGACPLSDCPRWRPRAVDHPVPAAPAAPQLPAADDATVRYSLLELDEAKS